MSFETYSSLNFEAQTLEAYTLKCYDLENLQNCNFLVIDLEATGLAYQQEEIAEIAILPIEEAQALPDKAWSTYVQTAKEIPAHIQKLTGITNEDTKSGLPLADVLLKLVNEYPEHIWVAQCGFEFDFPFLDQEHRRFFGTPLPVGVLDTKILYANLYPETRAIISTDFLKNVYGINSPAHERHTATGDVALLAELFLCILQDYREHGVDSISLREPLRVLKFVPPALT
jgi:DNA polymerase III alpha subunit (gram-positive type)